MKVWLITQGEVLPIDPGGRIMRTGQIARLLSQRGHEVIWWADAFSHVHKTYRSAETATVEVLSNYRIELLHAPPYSKNISCQRIRNHRAVAREFRKAAPARPKPDVILCGFPPIELAREATAFAEEREIPVVMDIRDPWPDLFLGYFPRWLSFPLKALLAPYARTAREALSRARAFTATSEAFLNWGLERAGRQRRNEDRVFYIGCNPPTEATAPKSLTGSSAANFARSATCVFIGTFGSSYDLETVVRAARVLEKEDHRDVRFILAGDGELLRSLQTKARGLQNLKFPGWVSAPQAQDLLATGRIGLVAVKSGAIHSVPNKAFEYMSGGLALLNSTRGDLWDLIESERIGRNYRSEDAEDFLHSLRDLLDRPEETDRMGERARKIFYERFDAQKIYPRMIEHVLSLAGTPNVPFGR